MGPHSSPRVPASCSTSTPAAQLVVEPVPVSTEWVQLREGDAGKTYYWNRRTNRSVWKAPAGVEVVWYGTRDEEGSLTTGTKMLVLACTTSLLFLLFEGGTASPGRYTDTGRRAVFVVSRSSSL